MRLLIIGPAWVGDMVMAQALFRLLHEKNKNIMIDVLAPEWTRPLLERMPEVNEAISLPFQHGEFALRKRWQSGKLLREKKYDQAIVLPNSWKSAIIPWAAKIPIRTGFLGEFRYGLLNDLRYLNKKQLPLMIERFLALGFSKNQKININLNINLKNYYPALKINYSDKLNGQKIIALCPGAEFGPSKRWPLEHYAEVAREQIKAGHEVWLFGSQKDKVVTVEIQKLVNFQCRDFAGETSLGEAIDLLSLVNLVITNDSGLMHIAAALNKPLIALYGSTDANFTPPLSDPEYTKILSITLPCRPCFQRECPLKHHDCMKKLLPEKVLAEIDLLLKSHEQEKTG